MVTIGIDRYADPLIPDLMFAANDARRLADVCSRSRHANEIVIHSLTDEDATRDNVLHLIGTDLANRTSTDDIVLFYFAGHGSPETISNVMTATRFLACHDTYRERLFSSGIDIGVDLVRAAERLQASLVVFFLDACFSGYSGGRGFLGPTLERYRRERRAGLKLADLELGTGIAYIGAATDTEVAWEDERLGHGVFSYYVFEELTNSEPMGRVGLATLYDRVYTQVRSFSNNAQHPVLWGTVTGAGLPLLSTS